jgi:porin
MYTITDGKANPIKWSATAAFEMNGPLPGRSSDVFGVGYFHNELADGFKDVVGPLLSFASGTEINIEDTEGFEAFYKAQLTPWFALTGDVQVITETLSTEETKVVTGVRAKVTF